MLNWLSANLINIVLIAVIVTVTGLLIRGMIRDRKAGKLSCGGNCAACGRCGGCSSCCKCGMNSPLLEPHPTATAGPPKPPVTK